MGDFRVKKAFYIDERWKNRLMPVFLKRNNEANTDKYYL